MKRFNFDKEAFRKVLKLKALRVPLQQCSFVRHRLKEFVLSLRHVKPVQHDLNQSTRILLLDESLTQEDQMPKLIQKVIEEEEGISLVNYEVEMDYSKLSAYEVLKSLLPVEVVIPTSFESVGHVAHLNLREEHLPYKYMIGEVFLDKNPSISTIINKIGTVENEFRSLDYEVLAGDSNLVTEVKQEGFRFQLDFGKVYWNSRLQYEHNRLVDLFQPSDVIVDLMAGVGPFAIRAAKKGCLVFANDKNPASYEYLVKNIEFNKVLGNVFPFNLDARMCLRTLLALEGPLKVHFSEDFEARIQKHKTKAHRKKTNQKKQKEEFRIPQLPICFQHVVMNYPQYAISFLDMFRGIFDQEVWKGKELPVIHCYAFIKDGESEHDMRKKCEEAIGGNNLDLKIDFHIVRNVSPNKLMCCMSFQLPPVIAFAPNKASSNDFIESKIVKKQKCEDNKFG